MNDQTFASRNEAIDFGKDYEYLMAAYYGLTLSFNDEIKNFKISSNNNDFGDFDDVVIECSMANGEEHVFALQLKHFNRPIAQVTLIQKTKKNDKFYLKKYADEFQKVKTMYAKKNSYGAPFQNFHFILISNSPLEKCGDFNEDWKKLEPVADEKIIESGLFIRKIENSFGKNLLVVPQKTDEFLYVFKPVEDNSPDKEFFEKFFFFTQQKDAKEMEAFIAEIILKKFQNCDPNVAVNYLNYFNYWCRRDYGTLKLTKEDVRVKLAELILTKHIPDPDLEKMGYFCEKRAELLNMIFLLFDIVTINVGADDELINKVWEALLREFRKLTKQWSTPFPGVYVTKFARHLQIPISAFSENFNEMSLKKMYILLWHTGITPLVLQMNNNLSCTEDLLTGIELCENNGKKKKFLIFDENNVFSNLTPKWTIFRKLSDLATKFEQFYDLVLEQLFVSLQGRPVVGLKEILQIDKCLIEDITTKEVVLMLYDSFKIGSNYMKDFPKHYIKRKIPKILVSINAINELRDDLFIVSCTNQIDDKNLRVNLVDIDKYLLLKQFGCNKNYFPRQIKMSKLEHHEDQGDTNENFCIYVNGICTIEQLEEIYYMNEERNCHHVRYIDEEKIEWMESRSSVSSIDKYVLNHQNFKSEDYLEDENILSYFKNQINVLCAEPGMGKSIMMKYLAHTCTSNHWVVMISLGEHVNFFKQEHDTTEVLDHFLKIPEQIPFVRNLISALSWKKQLLFLWDGFDELPEECVEVVIAIIKSLAVEGYPQWVAARPNSKKLLQDKFTTLALVLPEFTPQNQYDYVYRHLKEKYQDDIKVQEVIDEVNKNITVSLNCGYFDYTGIPLQIYMVVDIYLRKPNTVTNTTFITLTDIYQTFIEGKFDSLFEKAEADLDNIYMQEIREQYVNSQLTLYEKAAMKASFDDRSVEVLDLNCEELLNELEKDIDYLGLITSVGKNKKPIFAHKTYGEFLVASWLVKHCHTHQNIVKLLFEEKYSNIRLMFDMLLAKDSPVHLAVLYRNIDIIQQHQENIESCKDKGGRSVLHVACSWGRVHPLVPTMVNSTELEPTKPIKDHILNVANYIEQSNQVGDLLKTVSNFNSVLDQVEKTFNKLYQNRDTTVASSDTVTLDPNNIAKVEMDDEAYLEMIKVLLDRQFNIFETDSLLNWNVFQYADQSLSLGAINLLIKHHNIPLDTLNNYNHVPTLLHYSVIFLYDNLLEIVKEIPYIEYRYHFGRLSLLQMASEANNLKVVKELLKHKPYKEVIDSQSAFSGNLLASAAFHGNLEMLDILLENGAKVNGHIIPPLYAATLAVKTDCFKRLLAAGADVNETASDGNSALVMSTMTNQLEYAELLLENGGDVNHVFDGITALDCAVARENFEAVRLILRYNPDINRQCEKLGYTALHVASESGNIDIVKYLLENGASTKIKSKKLLTPLHVSLINGKKEIALELIKVDPSVANEYSSDNLSPIVLATMANFPDVVQTLVKCGADIHSSRPKSTPLHVAAAQKFDVCMIELIKAGASVNHPDEDGVTPLSAAVNHVSATQILLDNSADINARSKNGNTVAHFAAYDGNLEVMEELIKTGVDLNAQNNANHTPLCVAVLNKQTEMTKYLLEQLESIDDDSELLSLAIRGGFTEYILLLIEKGADVNAKDRNGVTPLQYALFHNPSCVSTLLQNGANANSGGDFQVSPVLMSLVLSQSNVMSQLISSGADLQAFGTSMFLHHAAKFGDIFSLVLLAGRGADVNLRDNTGRIPLHYACGNGLLPTAFSTMRSIDDGPCLYINKNREDCVKELLLRGSHVNQKDDQGVTPLHVACQDKCLEAVKLLVQNGAEVNAVNNKGQSALHMCYIDDQSSSIQLNEFENKKFGSMDIIKELIDHGIDINLKDEQGRTALFYACSRGDLDALIFLHNSGADLFVKDNKEDTLLAEAVPHLTLIKYLVEEGIKVDCTNLDGITPVYRSAACGNYDATLYMLEHGANVDTFMIKNHLTPIHAATINGHVKIVELLLKFNANLSIKCSFGNTPVATSFKNIELIKLFGKEFKDLKPDELKNGMTRDELRHEWIKAFIFSASEGSLEVLKFLHENGLGQVTDTNQNNGYTALHVACINGRYETAVYLIENGADVNAKDVSGNVPLYCGANYGYLDIIKVLVENGAEVDVSNNHGNTALFAAAASGHFQVVEFLHENGANINVIDEDGDTPLHDAAFKGHLSIVQFLTLVSADTKYRNKKNKTALDLAIDQGNQQIVDILISLPSSKDIE